MSSNSDQIMPSEQAELQEPTSPLAQRLAVIGIGASAGGLAALRAFFHALPAHSGLTFVVIVHLSPEHESILASLLQPYIDMPVLQVNEHVQMQREHIYVIPPGKQMLVVGDALEVVDFEESAWARSTRFMQIDAFFRSLAESHGDGGAIILSGSGSDGAVGIHAIKEKGGLLLVQSPEEAEYDGMPRSAIATGLVDIVATAAELAMQLVAAKQMQDTLQLPTNGEPLSDPMQQTLTQILTQLRVRTGHDFSGYKQATLLRRLARRMQITQVSTLTTYLHRLRQDTGEAELLFRDLLINVTEFFRDSEAWATLEKNIIPQIFAGKGPNDTVRVWTVGCATGEEAYSIAILLLEYVNELAAPPTIQVFASDLGKLALDFAREGIYPSAISDSVSEVRLNRFFTKENSHYRVRPELRETILFTQHNLLQDPPFSRLDLIICRNLLIYIQRDLQEKVFETFYYALRGDGTQRGFLFLGNAESTEGATELFDTLDKRHRLYQRHLHKHALPILPSLPLHSHAVRLPTIETEVPRIYHPSPGAEHQRLLEVMAPPSVLIDRDYNVLHLSESVGRYLLPPGGTPTTDLLNLVRPELQSELRTALVRAFEEHKAISTRPIPVRFNGAPHPVYLMVRPHQSIESPPQALVFFWEDETPILAESNAIGSGTINESVRKQLEVELRHSQNRLQSMREEYETTVEELRAANEELQSTNEEYKSTLEELETSKEELQSVNEELQTINQELKTKIDEVTHAHSDVQNLFLATDIATLFLDRELRVKRYTPSAGELFNLMPTDRGRPIAHLRSNLLYEALEVDAQRVLTHLAPVEREAQSQNGRWFLIRLLPYRTLEDRIDGVVITFIDITSNKANEAALRNAKDYAESIVHTIPDALLVLNPDLRVQMANDAFYEVFQVQRGATEGQLIYELGNSQWNIPALRTLLEEILPKNKIFTGYEVEHTFEQIGRRTMLVNGRQLDHAQLILLAITDITERKHAEEALRTSEEQHRTLFDAIDEGVCLFERLPIRPDERRDYRYIAMNPAMQEMFGIPDLSGQSLRDNFPNEAEEWYDYYDQVLETGQPLRFERESKPQGMVLEMFVTRIENGPSQCLLAVMQNVTERKRREANLAFLAELSAEFAPYMRAEELMARLCEKLGHYLELSRCDFSVVDEAADRITTLHDWRRDADAPSVMGEHAISTFLTPAARQHYATGNMAVVVDTHHDPMISAAPEMMDALCIRAVVDSPFLESGHWKFLVSACRSEVSAWRADEIDLICEVTGRIYNRLERAHAEEALRESEGRFRLMADTVPQIIWLTDAEGRVTFFNKRWTEYSGVPFEPTTAAEVAAQFIHPEDAPLVVAAFDKARQTGLSFEIEQRNRSASGEYRWFLNRAAPYRDPQSGEILQWFGVGIDIQDRKLAEAALRESEERQAFLLSLSDVLRPLTDPVEIQQHAVRILGELLGADRVGYAEDQGDGDTVVVTRNYVHGVPSLEGRYRYDDYGLELLRELSAGHRVVRPDIANDPLLTEAEKKAHAVLQLGSTVNIPLVKGGRLLAILFVHCKEARMWAASELELMQETADRTWAAVESARAEVRLRQREAELAQVQQIGGVGGLDIDITNGLTGRRSPEYLRLHGLPTTSANETHEDWLQRVHPDDREQANRILRDALAGTGNRYESEYRIIRPSDGEERWIAAIATIERNAQGQPTRLVGAHIDITERKRAELALQELNATLEQEVDTRTTQVRELASTLTLAEQRERRRLSQMLHDDLQQLLYGVQMRLVSVMQDIDNKVPASVLRYAEETDAWLTQAIQMVRQLTVDLSPPVLKGEGLSDALRWLVRQMLEVNGLHVKLQAEHAFRLPSEDMRVLLFQIVRELLFNVVKHSGTDHARVELLDGMPGILRIVISDEGRGFDPTTLSVKQEGGFGLFSIRERLDLFSGRMEIQSAPGQGTHITLTVPVGVVS